MGEFTLQSLLDEHTREGGNLADFLTEHADDITAEQISALENEAGGMFDGLLARPDKTTEDTKSMEALVEVVEALQAEGTRRAEANAEQQAHLDELAKRIGRGPKASDDPDGDDTDEENEEGDDADTPAEGEPAQPDPSTDPGPDPGTGPDGGREVEGLEIDIPDDASSIVEPVTAAGKPATRVTPMATRRRLSVASIAKRVQRPTPPTDAESKFAQVMVAAADVPGMSTGHSYQDWGQLAEAAIKRFNAMPRPRDTRGVEFAPEYTARNEAGGVKPGRSYDALVAAAGGGKSMTYGLAQIHKPKNADLALNNHSGDINKLIDFAADESRLSGPEGSGSLVAAGGWCGPPDRWLDFCELRDSNDGLFDMPTVNLTRGRVEYWQGPDYCAMWDMIADGFFGPYTSAMGDGAVEKPCVEIPCPDEPLMCEQEAYGLCVTAGILTRASWPEWIERFLQFAVRAHARRMSAVKLQAVVDGSQALGTVTLGAAAAASILNAIELQVEWLRYRWRMARNATVEMLAPFWIIPAIKADLANREGVENFEVDTARILRWFAQRGVRIQWVYDWQPLAGCGQTPPNGIGGTTGPIACYPDEVEFVIYPAGTWVSAEQDIIDLSTLYSPELLRINRYQALFSEEALCIIQRCPGSYKFRVPVCPTGSIGARVEVPCGCSTSPGESPGSPGAS